MTVPMPTVSPVALLAVLLISLPACRSGEGDQAANPSPATATPAPEDIPVVDATEASPYGPVALEYVSSIGSAEEEDYLFSIIRGVAVDREGNVVVFDGILRNIRVFSPDGVLLRQYDLPEGQGPGEFMRASTFSLSHDKTRLYIYDMINRRITILDYETFDYVHAIPLPETDHTVPLGAPNRTIATAYDQLNLGEEYPLVHLFDEEGNEVGAFEKRHEDFLTYYRQDLQRFHAVSMARSDSLWFISFGYPYDVRVYNTRYELLRRFRRVPDFFGDSFRKNDFLYPTGVCTSIVVAEEQLLLHLLRDEREGKTWIHAFDFDGRLRGELDMGDARWGGQFFIPPGAVDPKGFVYGFTTRPYPHVLKFKIVTSEAVSS